MYVPTPFQETRPEVLAAAIRDIQFAALVTPTAAGIEVTHAPMILREEDRGITLEAHVARGNPHWKALGGDSIASVAIFQGPQAYVSPAWYPSKAEHGKVVPTWVYITVHAHGRLETEADPVWLGEHLDALTARNEAGRDAPWAVEDAPEEFIRSMTRGIVGLRLRVERLEGAWKINQHKPAADRAGTAEGLRQAGDAGRALAAHLDPKRSDRRAGTRGGDEGGGSGYL